MPVAAGNQPDFDESGMRQAEIKLRRSPAASIRATRFLRRMLLSPARLPVMGFGLLIVVGTLLLLTPAATRGGIGFVDALFTATSAACVTGLAVVDTGTAFTRFGQVVILSLIQAGGLGIMTLSTLFLLVSGRRLSMVGRVVIKDTFTHSHDRDPTIILRDVILLALTIEAVGTVALFAAFYPDYPAGEAAYIALFHSVSAFCNAGFSLFPDSLVRYRGSLVVNLTVCGLIVAGGLGFLVLSEIIHRLRSRRRFWSRMSLHSKLVISATLCLLAAGAGLVLALEWGNTLAGLSTKERFLAAFFQSVTTRTAGFNTLPLADMANVTLFIFILLMFIGAGPGSCGGGVKVTTAATLFFLGLSRYRHQSAPQAFSRTLAETSLGKAVSLVLTSLFVIMLGTGLLLMTELGGLSHMASRGRFLEILFEMVSAFATVGLSMGATDTLSTAGRLIITAAMFIGRLGPLVIAVALTLDREPDRFHYATDRVMIG